MTLTTLLRWSGRLLIAIAQGFALVMADYLLLAFTGGKLFFAQHDADWPTLLIAAVILLPATVAYLRLLRRWVLEALAGWKTA